MLLITIHTPAQTGTEDYYFTKETNKYLKKKYGIGNSVPANTDITNPNTSYTYKNLKIVYNGKTGNFLAIWTQYSDTYGEQLMAQIIRYTKNDNRIAIWEEPRILNKVFFTKNGNTWSPDNSVRICQTDIAVDLEHECNYAIVSIKLGFKGYELKLPQIRLVPVILWI